MAGSKLELVKVYIDFETLNFIKRELIQIKNINEQRLKLPLIYSFIDFLLLKEVEVCLNGRKILKRELLRLLDIYTQYPEIKYDITTEKLMELLNDAPFVYIFLNSSKIDKAEIEKKGYFITNKNSFYQDWRELLDDRIYSIDPDINLTDITSWSFLAEYPFRLNLLIIIDRFLLTNDTNMYNLKSLIDNIVKSLQRKGIEKNNIRIYFITRTPQNFPPLNLQNYNIHVIKITRNQEKLFHDRLIITNYTLMITGKTFAILEGTDNILNTHLSPSTLRIISTPKFFLKEIKPYIEVLRSILPNLFNTPECK